MYAPNHHIINKFSNNVKDQAFTLRKNDNFRIIVYHDTKPLHFELIGTKMHLYYILYLNTEIPRKYVFVLKMVPGDVKEPGQQQASCWPSQQKYYRLDSTGIRWWCLMSI